MKFGKILKGLRLEQNLSQVELARRAQLAPSCIGMLESELRTPTANTLIQLSAVLHVSVDYLLGLEDDFGMKTSQSSVMDLNDKELNLIEAFRNLMPETQDFILNTVRALNGKNAEVK